MFHGYKVSVWDDEKVLEKGSGGGSMTLQMYLMPLNCMVKMVNFMYILPQ